MENQMKGTAMKLRPVCGHLDADKEKEEAKSGPE